MEMRLPNNDSVEPFIGNEGVGIRGDKPRPIAIAGDCCPLFGGIDGLRRSIDSNNRAAGETLAEIAKSYAVDISMISRL